MDVFKVLFQIFFVVGSQEDIPLFYLMHFCSSSANLLVVQPFLIP